MSDQLIDEIARDLGLEKLKGSIPPAQYQSYISYTAATFWVKASINDRSLDYPCGSHKHSVYVTNQFINKIIEIYPDTEKWFRSGYKSLSPSQKIIDIMLETGEINEIGLDSNNLTLALPEKTLLAIAQDISIRKGAITNDSDVVAGLSTICNINSGEDPILIDNSDWVSNYLDNIDQLSVPMDILAEKCYYYEPFRPYSQSFQNTYGYSGGSFMFFKTQPQFQPYYHVRYKGKNYRLNEDLIERGDGYRFILELLKEFKNNSVKFTRIGADLFKISLSCPMPRHETSLLLSVMWPERHIDDRFNFVGLNCVLPFVENIMKHLGLVIKWQN